MRGSLAIAALLLGLGLTAGAARPARAQDDEPGPGLLRRIVFYVPDRVLDLLDPVRVRARVGPGAAIDLRATEGADFFLGGYDSFYVGLPGPRGRRLPRLPIGVENRRGAEVGVADLTTGLGLGPDYSSWEFGIGLHFSLIGIDVGFDPLELVDFATGFALIDLRDDDF